MLYTQWRVSKLTKNRERIYMLKTNSLKRPINIQNSKRFFQGNLIYFERGYKIGWCKKRRSSSLFVCAKCILNWGLTSMAVVYSQNIAILTPKQATFTFKFRNRWSKSIF